jgi:ACS family tartrate transporter-like MFS transporter
MASVTAASADAGFTPEQEKILSKVLWRIVPFLLLCYIVAYLDRVNVGIASLTMNRDLGISPYEFGWSAGLFFFGYFLAEVPSNLALQAIGARKWIARILITWGLISAATAFVIGPVSFGVMRFLLGLGEAGFTPGVFLYFTYWFPARARGTATAAFLLGIPIANIIGAPISSSLLTIDGVAGLHGWQWLLILEGLPATILGFVCFFTLTDKPEHAKWLSPDERSWLAEVLAAERQAIAAKHSSRLRDAFLNWRVLVCAAVNFCAIIGSVGLGLWMPQIIKGLGFGVVAVGFIAAVPYICGAITMMLWARLSDKGGERSWFVASALLLGAGGIGCLQLRDVFGADLGYRAVRRRDWDHVLPIHLLADPVELPHRQRCCRRSCDDRLDRKSGRLRRSLSHWCDQTVDRQLLMGPDFVGRVSHLGRHPDPCGWCQSAATGRGG